MLRFGFEIPAWHGEAACRPELWAGRERPDFFAGPPGRARAVCDSCPVVEACLAEALANPWMLGVWGGTTERQRLAIRRKRAAVVAA